MRDPANMEKSADAFRTISEVGDDLGLPHHVLRFWETRFSQIKPLKRGGGRRYYRPDDVELVRAIQHLLYSEGYTIKGVQRILKAMNLKGLIAASRQMRESGATKMLVVGVASNLASENDDDDDVDIEAAEPDGARAVQTISRRAFDELVAAASELDDCARLLRDVNSGGL